PDETPAARLRAVLDKCNDKAQTTTTIPASPATPSELDSDFEAPTYTAATPSMAQKSLMDVFSRAYRDPGDTPQKSKPRRRRNSADISDIDAVPRAERIQLERDSYKGKRKSLSDDEVE
ncbi:hypothetical protein C8J56DRAFT_750849, partial [Mycena floridula]